MMDAELSQLSSADVYTNVHMVHESFLAFTLYILYIKK